MIAEIHYNSPKIGVMKTQVEKTGRSLVQYNDRSRYVTASMKCSSPQIHNSTMEMNRHNRHMSHVVIAMYNI